MFTLVILITEKPDHLSIQLVCILLSAKKYNIKHVLIEHKTVDLLT